MHTYSHTQPLPLVRVFCTALCCTVLLAEPGYYEDGVFGVRTENVLLVREHQCPHNFGGKGYLSMEPVTFVSDSTVLLGISYESQVCFEAWGMASQHSTVLYLLWGITHPRATCVWPTPYAVVENPSGAHLTCLALFMPVPPRSRCRLIFWRAIYWRATVGSSFGRCITCLALVLPSC